MNKDKKWDSQSLYKEIERMADVHPTTAHALLVLLEERLLAGEWVNERPKGAFELRVYRSSESAVFRKTKDRYGGLSNMAAGFPLVINGVRIRTSEALYQAFRFPDFPEIQELILREASPMTAKMQSKTHIGKTRPDWEEVKVQVMRWCLRVKLCQNWEKFTDALTETGEMPIVEFSTIDSFWGAAPTPDGAHLVGINVLGRLLMELRSLLNGPNPAALRTVPPPSIEGTLFLGRSIGAVSGSEKRNS